MCDPHSFGKAVRFLACCLLGLLLTGCSSEGPVPVTGKVTLDGKSVSGASITFTPVNSKEGEVAVGSTDDSGMYSLNLLKGEVRNGAMPGAYKVSISKEELADAKAADGNLGAGFLSLGMPTGGAQQVRYLIPPKYNSTSTSGLSFEIKRGEDNTANFELSAE